jgi:hypothetical protein
MSDIDWSKAPEGATHWDPVDRNHLRQFGKISQSWYEPGKSWESSGWQYPDDLSIMPRLIARPRPWSGEGLPPVGTVCEFAGGTPCPEDPFDKDLKEGMPVTIIAHFKSGDFTLAAFTFDPKNPDRGMVQVEQGNFGCFRPIRTPEQIAAEEQEARISVMVEEYQLITGRTADAYVREALRAIDSIGYRKQEAS